MNNKQWEEEFEDKLDDEHSDFYYDCEGHCAEGNLDNGAIIDFIKDLLSQREAEIRKEQEDYIKDLEKSVEILQTKGKLDKQYFNEIRKEYEFDTNKSLEDKIDNIINNPPTWTDGNPKSQLERIMGVFNAELSKIRKETIESVMKITDK